MYMYLLIYGTTVMLAKGTLNIKKKYFHFCHSHDTSYTKNNVFDL